MNELISLNVGCGNDKRPGFINIDSEPMCNPDVVMRVDVAPWSIPDAAVAYIEARHVVEHLHDLRTFFTEAYRVMVPGAIMRITVPHHWSDGYTGDFTHVRPITIAGLELLSKRKNAEWKAKGWPNTPLGEYWQVDFEVDRTEAQLMPQWSNTGMPEAEMDKAFRTYLNVLSEVTFMLRRV